MNITSQFTRTLGRKKLAETGIFQVLKRTILAFPFKAFQDKINNVGYLEFKNQNGIQKTRQVINSILVEQKNNLNRLSLERKILGFSEFDLYISYIQVHYSYIYDDKFITKPLSFCSSSKLKIWYPIKYKDQSYFTEKGMEVNTFVCDLLWKFSVVSRILIQIFEQLKDLVTHKNKANNELFNSKRYSLVLGASLLALEKNTELYNFRNWIENKIINESDAPDAIYTKVIDSNQIDVKNGIYLESFLFKASRIDKLQIFIKTIYLVVASGIRARRDVSFLILINFKSLILAQIFRIQNPLKKPHSYYFTSLYGNSMPLWAIDEMLAGKRICFVFLASYSEPKFKSNSIPGNEYWQLSRWPIIYLIDKIHEVQLGLDRNPFCKSIVHIGPPDWVDEAVEVKVQSNRNIFLFDGEMQKNYKGLSSMYEYGWDEISTNIKFIKDVTIVAKECNYQVYLKPKRPIGPRRFESYASLLRQINDGDFNNVSLLNENVSVKRLCKIGGISISKPFSTSGLVSKEESMTTIFYDPLGNKFEGDPGLRGIRLISNVTELRNYLMDYGS